MSERPSFWQRLFGREGGSSLSERQQRVLEYIVNRMDKSGAPLRHVPASAAALYINLVPVVGLGSALLFGESVGAAQLVGGMLAVAGVLLGDAVLSKGRGRTS